ncbi:mucoidy inhibitor MuiA family protein [Myxococcus qinghaiensis]|uniref:mucoidy inhibitor MuiA family protein n=1 Tax=Myxococcus qinghaiensis TaxID=2906758 RepID=UPI0020A797E5|nr:mucoidy inhibitor MuiA family protein [Myxococcus qinghaiensis]MCP3166342.1 mucoidy inhibitor MuiA family protein [Myxococcus qinghaiensis]
MLLLGLGWAASHLLHASVEAPITGVTVYSDRARVVRTASVEVSGTQRLELPSLPGFVDPASVQVEAEGARIASVEVKPTETPIFPEQEARKLLVTLDRLDDALARTEAERAAHVLQVAALRRIQPMEQGEEDAVVRPVSPASWATATSFLIDMAAKLEGRMRELEGRALVLKEERRQRLGEAERLATPSRGAGVDVGVLLTGSGLARVRVSYLVTQAVRWYPRYELQLQPAQQRVQVALSGRVSQETGEDWSHARLTLSTALPSQATALPKLSAWKLGSVERFIPTPVRKAESSGPPPPLPSERAAPNVEQALRRQLRARVGTPAASPSPSSNPAVVARSSPVPAPSPSPDAESRTGGGARLFGSGTLHGTVIDAQSRGPASDVVVTAISPALGEEDVVVTDARGDYRFTRLPPGNYTLRFERESFKPYVRTDVQLGPGRALRVPVELLPESLGEVVEIVGAPPTIDVGSTTTGMGISLNGPPTFSRPYVEEPVVDSYVGLAPPQGYVPPTLSADLPAALAGGHDLAFTAPRLETVPSARGERSIPLLIESWPVQVERHVYPALASEAFLVAQLKSPSSGALPGGAANLFVGDEPVGTATLKVVVPGEPFTLPLGVDPAVRTTRNVRLVQSKEGFISKDEINTYEVTLEIPNPYSFPLQTQVVDQLPVSGNRELEVKLVRADPEVQPVSNTGELRWRVVVPPGGKQTVTFEYSLRRPQHWRLEQSHWSHR